MQGRFWGKYARVLGSESWADFRRQILAKHTLCQACGELRARVVHHLHYKTLGKETTGDVVALCDICHDYLHGTKKIGWGKLPWGVREAIRQLRERSRKLGYEPIAAKRERFRTMKGRPSKKNKKPKKWVPLKEKRSPRAWRGEVAARLRAAFPPEPTNY